MTGPGARAPAISRRLPCAFRNVLTALNALNLIDFIKGIKVMKGLEIINSLLP